MAAAAHRSCGIQSLVLTTIPGGSPASTIKLPGVRNCLAVRDMLADIDAAREAGS